MPSLETSFFDRLNRRQPRGWRRFWFTSDIPTARKSLMLPLYMGYRVVTRE